jgi:hypothetical protein
VSMNTRAISPWRSIGAVVAALVGVAFFFFIIGVFGLPLSVFALVVFVALAILLFRCPQDEGTRP